MKQTILLLLILMITWATTASAEGRPVPDNTLQSEPLLQSGNPKVEPAKHEYKIFEFAFPKDQETIQNQPSFTVLFKIEPNLMEGDSIQLMMDGTPWQKPVQQPQVTMTNVDRGTHQLSAELYDSRGGVLRTAAPVTIYIHRASVAGG